MRRRGPIRGRWCEAGRGPPGSPSGVDRFGALSSSLSLVSKLRFVPVHQQTPRGLFLIWPSRTIALRGSVIIHTRRVTAYGRSGPDARRRQDAAPAFHYMRDDLRFHSVRPVGPGTRTRLGEVDSASSLSSERAIRTPWSYVPWSHTRPPFPTLGDEPELPISNKISFADFGEGRAFPDRHETPIPLFIDASSEVRTARAGGPEGPPAGDTTRTRPRPEAPHRVTAPGFWSGGPGRRRGPEGGVLCHRTVRSRPSDPERKTGTPRRESPSQRLSALFLGGAKGSRTPDLRYAKPALCQLSYGPMNPDASPGHSGEHTFIGGRSRSPGRVPHAEPRFGTGSSTKPWVAPRDYRPTHVFVSLTSGPGRRARQSPVRPVEAPRPRQAARRSVGQLSLAAVASVHRSSSARSAWILR